MRVHPADNVAAALQDLAAVSNAFRMPRALWKERMSMWRKLLLVLFAGFTLLPVSLAFAQDEPKPEQLKKMYDDALVQLRQAQDRKNELAAENDKLNAKIADLQKQLDGAKAHVEEVNRQAASYADKTFFLRSHYAAWRRFIQRYPKLEAEWRVFLEGGSTESTPSQDLIDTDWPLSAAG
jgi:septal ring factor EnvC (AmiA/AmiB activator)